MKFNYLPLLLIVSLAFISGCSTDDGIIIINNLNYTNITYSNQTGATSPYLYMLNNNVTLNITPFLAMFLTSESDPIFTANNVSIWSAINDLRSNDTMTSDALNSKLNINQTIPQTTIGMGRGTYLIDGGIVVQNSNLTINISSGSGVIYDSNTQIASYVTWNATNNYSLESDIALGTDASYVLVNSSGNIFTITTDPTDGNLRNDIYLSKVAHRSGNIITNVRDFRLYGEEPLINLNELTNAIGSINIEGNVITPYSSDLRIKKSAGTAYRFNINTDLDRKNPSYVNDSALSPITFIYCQQKAGGGVLYTPNQTSIDPTKQDIGNSTLASIPGGQYSIQRVYYFPRTNSIYVFYGRNTYSSMSNAITYLNSESFDLGTTFFDGAILRAYIIVKSGTTDLSDANNAKFISLGKFAGVGSAGLSISASDIQNLGFYNISQDYTNDSLSWYSIDNPNHYINTSLQNSSYACNIGSNDKLNNVSIIDGLITGVCSADITGNNPFDQVLNTTSNVSFNNVAVSNYLLVGTNVPPSSDINTPSNAVIIDGDNMVGKGYVLSNNGAPIWDISTYQNESMRFIYNMYNYLTDNTILTASDTGLIGLNKEDNIIEDESFFNGSGINYFHVSGMFNGEIVTVYKLTMINSTNIAYQTSIDGASFSNYIRNWSVSSNTNYYLERGISVNWSNTSSLVQNQTWIFVATPQDPQATLSISRIGFSEVLFYNASSGFIDQTLASATSQQGAIYDDRYTGLNRNNSYLYIGYTVKYKSLAMTLAVAGVGANLSIYYCNDSNQFQNLNFTNASVIDGTKNLTTSGTISWDISSFNWSNNCSVNNITNQYWLMINSSTQVTTSPIIYTLTPNGNYQFAMYDSPKDARPRWWVDSDSNIFNLTSYNLEGANLRGTSITSTGGVAVGGALSGASTIANSGTQTCSYASTLNSLSLYGLVLTSSTATTTAVPSQGAPLLSFRGKLWNGATDTNQEWNMGTTGDNTSKSTNFTFFSRNNLNINTTIFTITKPINSSLINFSFGTNVTININNNLSVTGFANFSDSTMANRSFVNKVYHAYGIFQNKTTTIPMNQSVWANITNGTGDLWTVYEQDGFIINSSGVHLLNTGDYTGLMTISISGSNGDDYFIRMVNIDTGVQAGGVIGATTTGASNFIPVTLPIYIRGTAGDTYMPQIINYGNNNDATVRSGIAVIYYLHN